MSVNPSDIILPRRHKPLLVEHIAGERMVFWVHSEAKPGTKYRVDLLEHGGRGMCSCPWWRKHVWTRVREGAAINDAASRCKHIEACREHVINETLKNLSAKETQP